MSVPVKRIEKDFLFKVIYDEQLPLVYLRNRTEYFFTLEKPAHKELFLRADRFVPGLKVRKKLNLMFDYRGTVHSFSAEIGFIRDDQIRAPVPDIIYKNLDRTYSRVTTPPDMEVQFTFLEDRYSLTYPKIAEYEGGDMSNFIRQLNLRDLGGLVDQISGWIKGCASGHKLLIFKDVKPSSVEERIIAETGKALYLSSTRGGYPGEDPYPRKRLVTEAMFKRYLESTGVSLDYVDDAYGRFIKSKDEEGLLSDAWVPILFQEYIIGYIHIWLNKDDEKPPFDYGVLDTLCQFTKILTFSLKENGYFDAGLLKNEPFGGKVIDISVSGLLFAYPHSSLASVLLPDSELSVRLTTPGRLINTDARIVRRYKDLTMAYFGCRFGSVEPEDLRYLFEYIYGQPFTEADARFLAGQV